MATWPSISALFDNMNLKGTDANPLMRSWFEGTMELPGALPAQSLSILNGAITPERAVVMVDTEGGAPMDELALISPAVSATNTLHDGMLLCIRAQDAARSVTVKHSTAINGIRTMDGQDIPLGTNWWLVLRLNGNAWQEMPLGRPVRIATTEAAGIVRPDGVTTKVDAQGKLSTRGIILGGCLPFCGNFGGPNNRHPIPRGGTEPDLNWVLCDGGSDGQGGTVPDLRGRMILGADETRPSGSTGGSERHDHSLSGTVGATTLSVAQVGSHNHTAGGSVSSSGNGGTFESTEKAAVNTLYTHASGGSQPHTHSLSTSTGEGSSLPPYYALAYIMRL